MVRRSFRLPVPLLAVLLALLFMLAAARAESPDPFIRLSIEADTIVLGDAVVLEIEATGLDEPVDLTVLDAIATRIRETAGTRVAVYSGQVVDIRIRRIEIVPKSAGVVVIGPLTAGDVTSNSVSVTVTQERMRDWTPTAQDIDLRMTVSDVAPLVQQQLVLDIAFRHRHPVSGEAVTLPSLDGFRAAPVMVARRTLEDDWRVVRWRYLLFPLRSGSLTLPPARIRGAIQKSRLDRAEFELDTGPLTLEVAPATMPGWWLPAADIRLTDEWTVDPSRLVAGGETERIVTVTARNALAEQLPDLLHPETRGLRITPLGEERETSTTGDGTSAIARFRYRIVAISPVPVFLDTIRVPWWDTAKNRPAEAILPARRIDVGIPDAATLTATLAGERSWTERLSDGVRGARAPLLLALVPLALAGMMALGLRRSVARQFRAWSAERRARAAVADCQGNPAALWRVLSALAREHRLAPDAQAALAEAERALFAPGPAGAAIAPPRRVLAGASTDMPAASLLPEL